MRFFVTTFLLSWLIFNATFAQKKILDHSVYDGWENVAASGITKDGKHIYYQIEPQEGDGLLYITTASNKPLISIPRATSARFSPDQNYLVMIIKPLYADTRQARIKKVRREEMPKDSLAIYSFLTNELKKIPNVSSYKLPEEAGRHLAFMYEEVAPKKDTTARDSSQRERSARRTAPTPKLKVADLGSAKDTTFERVESYFFSKDGQQIVLTKKADEKDSLKHDSGVYHFDLGNQTLKQISSGKGDYKQVTFDEIGSQLAFVADKSPDKAPKNYQLYYYTTDMDSARILIHSQSTGIPTNWEVSGNGSLTFSESGQKLFFGIAPLLPQRDTTLVEFEHAKVDIWHWQDDYLQTQQLVNLNRDRNRSYMAVAHLDQSNARITVLADENLPDIRLPDNKDSEYVLGTTDIGRRVETQWIAGSFSDIYIVSTRSGERQLIKSAMRGTATLSPTGKYLLWFDRSDGNWYCHDIANNQTNQLNKDLPISFADEDNDLPEDPNHYGVAGWTANDEHVILYDKYDIWLFHSAKGERRMLTNGLGRIQQTTFRYRDFKNASGDIRGRAAIPIDIRKPLLLTSFHHVDKQNGFYLSQTRANRDPKAIVVAPNRFAQINGAENADIYIYTKENYTQSPNLYVSKDFVKETQLSQTNPQQAGYNWGSAELVTWTTPKGYQAEGILYKPEDFDPNKKYPMIAYFYEILSNGLYSYIPPTPTPSRLNISFFVSNGYLVFAPDIKYEIGYPGQSAEEFVNSGVEMLKTNPWVDADKIGIQGQSWGGYQVAHLITRTNMYAAAWSGAPVVNMTSAYGGIRWQTGLNRQFQYEKTQSRIGATLWEKPELYIENSPLFHFPNVNTPVAIMHNDEDGAVPWYQGIEMFTALRRLGKPTWLLNYNGDGHNLVQRQNRKDIQRRQLEFFDHFLKEKTAAPWIESGVPAIKKGIDWGFGQQ